MNLRLILAGALFAVATPTFAADLAPAPMEPVAPVYVPYNWSGFYIGADIGYAWTSADSGVDNPFGIDLDISPDASGVIGGLYAGYNAQFGQIVVGIEADAELSDNSDEGTVGPFAVLGGGSLTTSVNENWRGSVRARLGYAIDTFLPYITGGVAWADWDVDHTLVVGGVGTFEASNSNTFVGWTIGAGLEYAFTPNIIGRVEYRYTDFGSNDNNVFGAVVAGVVNDVDLTDNAVRVGVAYKF
jgi:outer membrane immunogenic protein